MRQVLRIIFDFMLFEFCLQRIAVAAVRNDFAPQSVSGFSFRLDEFYKTARRGLLIPAGPTGRIRSAEGWGPHLFFQRPAPCGAQ
jgi:hypothetical protein